MLGKIYSLLGFVGAAMFLGGTALTGYLYFAGSLSGDRMGKIAAILRGEDAAATTNQPAASQPAGDSPEPTAMERPADEIRRQRREDRIQRALLERSKRDVIAQRELLETAMHDLVTRGDAFDMEKQRWEEARKLADQAERDEGFEQYMTYFVKLPSIQAKDELIRTWKKEKADALRIMTAVKPTEGKKILELMKTPEEAEIRHELLEQIRNQAVDSFAPKSGKTSGDASN